MKVFSVRGLLIASVLLALAAGGAAAVLVVRLPSVVSQIPPAPMIVTLTRPLNGSGAGAGATIKVSAQVVTPNLVAAVELWADGQRVSEAAPTRAGTNLYLASLDWSPGPGPHVLVVRAADDQGHIGVSNVVRVEGVVGRESRRMEPFVAQGGETLDGLAQRFGTTVPDILAYNRGLSEGQALEAGQEIQIPIPISYDVPGAPQPPPSEPLPEGVKTMGAGLSPLEFWLHTTFSPAPASPPAPPGLSAAVEGCGASLAIVDNSVDEAGFFLYRLGPASPAFERIATLKPHTGEGPFAFSDPELSGGAYTYYAAAFNTAGEAPGAMTQVILPPEACGGGQWTGKLQLTGSLLVSPTAADKAYFYVSVNGGQWRRVPSDPNAFLPAVQGGYDVSPYLADLAGGVSGPISTLSLDGWGWSGGNLVYLGQGALNAAPQAAVPNVERLYLWTALQGSANTKLVLAPGTKVPMYFSEEVVFADPKNFVFRWKSGSSEATSGRWQVSSSPYFLPTSILAEGVAGVKPSYQGYSYFNIPFDELLALTVNIGKQPTSPLMQGPLSFGSGPTLELGEGQSVALSPQFQSGLGPAFAAGLPLIGGGKLNEYYVRITPMIGNQIAGEASNTVVARYDPEADAGLGFQIPTLGPEYYTPLYTVEILDYTPNAVEDPNKWGCVKFVKVEPGSFASWIGYKVGEIYCPKPWTGGGNQITSLGKFFEAAFGWLEEGANWAAQAWQDIKEVAVQIILKYTPLGLQCQFAESVVLPEGACHTVFAAAVDAGLVAMGVPPSIPNFDQLMDQGLDYAVEIAAQKVLENSPAPCVGPCEVAVKDAIRDSLKKAIAEVAGQSVAPSCVSEQEAHKHGREPWCPPPGAVVQPVLGAVDSPPTILIRLTRRPDVPDPANLPTCVLQVGATYTLHGWHANYPEFSAEPFAGSELPIPPLSPGESMKIAVALNTPKVVNLPWKSYLGDPYVYHDWGNMVWYGTSHGWASARFVTPPFAQGTPSPCALPVKSPEVGSQEKGWK